MKTLIFNILLILTITQANSQKLNTPAEILKMMIDSKMKYMIDLYDTTKENKKECKDNSNLLNINMFYRIEDKGNLITKEYRLSKEEMQLLEHAEHAFQYNITDTAVYYYEKLLESNPKLFFIYTYKGQVYGHQKEHKKEIECYKKAIDSNYIDYMAHWFLADAYYLLEEYEKAKDEILIAHILNRNNKRLKDALIRILDKLDLKYVDWCFNPQYELNKLDETKISIKSSSKWSMYAYTKAFWEFEPGYKESMGSYKNTKSTIEESECLFSLILEMETKKEDYTGDLQFEALFKAKNNKLLIEYILFEIFLPTMPQAVYQYPIKSVESIKDYLVKIRLKKI